MLRRVATLLAGAFGWCVGRLARLAVGARPVAVGTSGAALISLGSWEAWHPLGPIVAGACLLLIDRRL